MDEYNCGDSVFHQSGVCNFSEGLCAVRSKGKWGFIDKTGATVIAIEYENAGAFHEGLACVRQNSKYGYIDKSGKVVIPIDKELPPNRLVSVNIGGEPEYKSTPQESIENLHFSCGRAMYFDKGRWGYIDKEGKAVIPAQYGMAMPFADNLAGVNFVRGGFCSFIDQSGKVVMPVERNCRGFSEGMFASNENPFGPGSRYYFIEEKTGKKIGPFGGACMFKDGLSIVTPLGKMDVPRSSGIIDKLGVYVVKPEFDFGSYNVSEGRAIVMDGEKQSNFGVIDLSGKAITKQKYLNLSDYYDGMALVRTERESTYIDKDGREVFKFPTHLCNLFSEGLAAVAAPPLKK